MKRRAVLTRTAAVLGTGALAGCLGSASGPGTGGPPTRSPQPTPTTPTTTPSPGLEATFDVTRRQCGTGVQRASVSFSPDAVAIDGTIAGSDTCDTAVLEGVELDDGTLVVSVATTREQTTGTLACGQCITDITYTARVEVTGTAPDRAVVRHDGRTVARADRP